MGRVSKVGQAFEDEGMVEETRAPSTSPSYNVDDFVSPAIIENDDEELLSIASHSSEEELESINAQARIHDLDSDVDVDIDIDVAVNVDEEARQEQRVGRKRSHPAASFSSSDDDDEISGILGPTVEFSASPPVDLPVVEPAAGPSPAKTLHFQNGGVVPSATVWTNSPMAIDDEIIGQQQDGGRLRRSLRQNDLQARQQVARLPRPFLDFDKMRQKAEHALTTWKHGNELTLACR